VARIVLVGADGLAPLLLSAGLRGNIKSCGDLSEAV
jgi:hypothetical protein